jgi:hypothetical protein
MKQTADVCSSQVALNAPEFLNRPVAATAPEPAVRHRPLSETLPTSYIERIEQLAGIFRPSLSPVRRSAFAFGRRFAAPNLPRRVEEQRRTRLSLESAIQFVDLFGDTD